MKIPLLVPWFLLLLLVPSVSGLAVNPTGPESRTSKKSPSPGRSPPPRVTLAAPPDHVVEGVSEYGIESFLAIPMAEAPRLSRPIRRATFPTPYHATKFPPGCIQFFTDKVLLGLLESLADKVFLKGVPTHVAHTIGNQTEDCLSINVQRPAGTNPDDNLPVLVWLYGGGFEFGQTNVFDGTRILYESVVRHKPVVYVTIPYRLAAFGFLGGTEVKRAGIANLATMDIRMGLEWVHDNIRAFGGDPARVTLWGESAGSFLAFNQAFMLDGDHRRNATNRLFNRPTNFPKSVAESDGPLFRAIIGNSGTTVPVSTVDSPRPQRVYDQIVAETGCGSAPDSLACLRNTDLDTFRDAMESTHALSSNWSVGLDYLPRPDGVVLPDRPKAMVLHNRARMAPVPMLLGNQEDEGTVMAILVNKVFRNKSDLVTHLETMVGRENRDSLDRIVGAYSSRPEDGAPFRTGRRNVLYPGFKQYAAILGDFAFTFPRREMLNVLAGGVSGAGNKTGATAAAVEENVRGKGHRDDEENPNAGPKYWSWINSSGHSIPVLGSFHTQELLSLFWGLAESTATDAMFEYFLSFVYTGDPNGEDGGAREVNKGHGKGKRGRHGGEARTGSGSGLGSDDSVIKPEGMPYWPPWDPVGKTLLHTQSDRVGFIVDDFRQREYEVMAESMDAFQF